MNKYFNYLLLWSLISCTIPDRAYTVKVWQPRLTPDNYKAVYDTIGRTNKSPFMINVYSIDSSLNEYLQNGGKILESNCYKILSFDTLDIVLPNGNERLYYITLGYNNKRSCVTIYSPKYGVLKVDFRYGSPMYLVRQYDIVNGENVNVKNFTPLIDSVQNIIYKDIINHSDSIKVIEVIG